MPHGTSKCISEWEQEIDIGGEKINKWMNKIKDDCEVWSQNLIPQPPKKSGEGEGEVGKNVHKRFFLYIALR